VSSDRGPLNSVSRKLTEEIEVTGVNNHTQQWAALMALTQDWGRPISRAAAGYVGRFCMNFSVLNEKCTNLTYTFGMFQQLKLFNQLQFLGRKLP
jgi:hypothetical protein